MDLFHKVRAPLNCFEVDIRPHAALFSAAAFYGFYMVIKNFPAIIKSTISMLMVGSSVFLFPFENKFLLSGILFASLIRLGKEVESRNELFLLSMFERSFVKFVVHPWMNVIGVMIIWWAGHSMMRVIH